MEERKIMTPTMYQGKCKEHALMLMKHPDNTVEMNRTWIQIFNIDHEIRQEEKKQNA